MSPAVRIANRHLCRLAARQACGDVRVASANGLTPDVVAAFAEGFYLPMHTGKVAFGGLVRKLKKLVESFRKAPRVWQQFQKIVGSKSLKDLPGAIKSFAKKGFRTFQKAMTKLFQTWPLKLYTLEKGKIKSFNDHIEDVLKRFPKLHGALRNGTRRIGDFGELLRQKAPTIAGGAMVAIYIWVWLNVVEFEWDFKALVDAITGAMSFPDFLSSLPGSAFGFLLSAFNLGTWTLLPYAVAARMLYLIAHRYVTWDGRAFHFDTDKLAADFGEPQRA